MMSRKRIDKLIDEAMTHAGQNITTLANETGIYRSAIFCWFKDNSCPNETSIAKLKAYVKQKTKELPRKRA